MCPKIVSFSFAEFEKPNHDDQSLGRTGKCTFYGNWRIISLEHSACLQILKPFSRIFFSFVEKKISRMHMWAREELIPIKIIHLHRGLNWKKSFHWIFKKVDFTWKFDQCAVGGPKHFFFHSKLNMLNRERAAPQKFSIQKRILEKFSMKYYMHVVMHLMKFFMHNLALLVS